ncbi:MAG: DUF4156 domain-containing protein [Deltaproteobacteria bacterium]|nr:DUF4156 domain-containing protein [Deltaproteobacteria bacterium]
MNRRFDLAQFRVLFLVLPFILIFFGVGCATMLSEKGESVTVLNSWPSPDCKDLGVVSGSESDGLTRGDDQRSLSNQLRNKTADLGGNVLIQGQTNDWGNAWIGGGSSGSGRALSCDFVTVKTKVKCDNGIPASCGKLADLYLSKAASFSSGLEMLKKACDLKNEPSCHRQAMINKKVEVHMANCRKGNAASCYDYGMLQGLSGNEAVARAYIKKACKLRNQDACDQIAIFQETEQLTEVRRKHALEQQTVNAEQQRIDIERGKLFLQQEEARQRNTEQLLKSLRDISSTANSPPSQNTDCSTRPIHDLTGRVVSYESICTTR